MCHRRSLVADAHVWPSLVVEADEAPHHFPGMLHTGEPAPAVDALVLDDAVDALGHGVVRGLAVLGHRDGDAVGLEHGHIVVAAVLHAAVGVVGQPPEGVPARHLHGLGHRLAQGIHGGRGPERVPQRPAHDLAGVRVGDEVQVAVPPAVGT